MWPIIFSLGTRFSSYLVFPCAAVIGTIGYYLEKQLAPKAQPIPYLEVSIQEQRKRRQATASSEDTSVEEQRRHTLSLNSPVRA